MGRGGEPSVAEQALSDRTEVIFKCHLIRGSHITDPAVSFRLLGVASRRLPPICPHNAPARRKECNKCLPCSCCSGKRSHQLGCQIPRGKDGENTPSTPESGHTRKASPHRSPIQIFPLQTG